MRNLQRRRPKKVCTKCINKITIRKPTPCGCEGLWAGDPWGWLCPSEPSWWGEPRCRSRPSSSCTTSCPRPGSAEAPSLGRGARRGAGPAGTLPAFRWGVFVRTTEQIDGQKSKTFDSQNSFGCCRIWIGGEATWDCPCLSVSFLPSTVNDERRLLSDAKRHRVGFAAEPDIVDVIDVKSK